MKFNSIKPLKWCLLLLALILIVNSCKKESESNLTPTPQPSDPDVVIYKTTKLVDEASDRLLERLDSTRLIFSANTGFIQNVQVGDVIVSGITSHAQYGYLVKVLAKWMEGGKVIFEIRPALLTEAIEKGRASVSKELMSADTAANGRLPTVDIDIPDFEFEQNINNVVKVNGKASLKPKFTCEIEIDKAELKKFNFHTEVDWQNELGVSANVAPGANRTIDKRVTIKSLHFRPIIVSIGWMPIIIRPEIGSYIGVSGSLPTETSLKVKASAKGVLGVSYSNSKWTPIRNINLEYTPANELKPSSIGNVKGYAGLILKTNFYEEEALSASIDYNLYTKLTSTFSSENSWEWTTGKEVSATINSSVLPRFLELSRFIIYQDEKVILSSGPSTLDVTSSTTTGKTSGDIIFKAKRKFIPSRYKYEWDFGDGTPLVTIKNDSTVKHQFTKVGNYTIKVVLKDGEFGIQLAQGSIIQKVEDSSSEFNIGDYSLEILANQDVNSYSSVKTIRPGSDLSIPNGLMQMFRLSYKGSIVKIAATSRDIGYENLRYSAFNKPEYPIKAEDIVLNNFNLQLYDHTNKRMVNYPVNLTLKNDIYRVVVGKTIKVSKGTMVYNLSFIDSKTFILRIGNSTKEEKHGYEMNNNASTYYIYIKCNNSSAIIRPIIGTIYLGLNSATIPPFIMVGEDGTLSGNSSYACPEQQPPVIEF